MRKLLLLACLTPLLAVAAKTLDFYTIDVEGGKSVLVVTPAGQSMLIDVGWPKLSGREASTEQIVAALKVAGLQQLDYLLISHFDVDHMGDVPALAARFPIRHILDHGEPAHADPERFKAYDELRRKTGFTVLKPGDKLPLKGVDVEVVTSAGRLINKPLPGAGAKNTICATHPQAAALASDVEDDQSIGLLFQFAGFRMLDLADLEAHLSHELVCPVNLIGTVDVDHVNVHGQFKGIAPELIEAIFPTVLIMGNGARKGADVKSWPLLRAAPRADIWQVHYSAAGTKDTNPPPDFIANLEQPTDQFAMIKISVRTNGTYSITNTRNGFTKEYTTHRAYRQVGAK